MSEWLWLGALCVVAWFWSDSLRARERAIALCRDACNRRALQLLDETVALERLALQRDRDGRVRIRRRYRFEFTRDGAVRDTGTVVMLGDRVVMLDLPEPGGRVIEHGEF
jgi:hypothetical protein